MLSGAFNITHAHDWQVEVIYCLAYLRCWTLCVQKTGGGKSLTILGSMALMRGVAIVIEPLLSINTDQAKSASRECPEGIHAFDVDGLQTADANLLIRQLKNLTPSTPSAVILYMSPHSLKADGIWSQPVLSMIRAGVVRLICI